MSDVSAEAGKLLLQEYLADFRGPAFCPQRYLKDPAALALIVASTGVFEFYRDQQLELRRFCAAIICAGVDAAATTGTAMDPYMLEALWKGLLVNINMHHDCEVVELETLACCKAVLGRVMDVADHWLLHGVLQKVATMTAWNRTYPNRIVVEAAQVLASVLVLVACTEHAAAVTSKVLDVMVRVEVDSCAWKEVWIGTEVKDVLCEALCGVPQVVFVEQLDTDATMRFLTWVSRCQDRFAPKRSCRFLPVVLDIMARPVVVLEVVHKCCAILSGFCAIWSSSLDGGLVAATPSIVDAVHRLLASPAAWASVDASGLPAVIRKELYGRRFTTVCCTMLKSLEFQIMAQKPLEDDRPSPCLSLVQPLCDLIQQYMKYKPSWWWTDVCEVVELFRQLAYDPDNHAILTSPSWGCVGVLTQLLHSETASPCLVHCAWALYENAEEFSAEDVQCLEAMDRFIGAYYEPWARGIPEGFAAKMTLARGQQRRWTQLRTGWIGAVGCHQAVMASTLAAEAALEAALAGEDSGEDSDSDLGDDARKRMRST
jgi:hypothetical protein